MRNLQAQVKMNKERISTHHYPPHVEIGESILFISENTTAH